MTGDAGDAFVRHPDPAGSGPTGRDPARSDTRGGSPVEPTRAATPPPSADAAAGSAMPGTEAVAPRFAQLTYTSFHRPDGASGWQVKDTAGDLTPEEQKPLVERATGSVAATKLPRFLRPDEVDALPRRLVYGPVRDAGAAYWHTVPAGTDSSGRPGNIFAHILLDRRPAAPTPPLRPSDLLRSSNWLRPFGEEKVLATRVDDVPAPPWPTGEQTRAAVLEFLVDRAMWRTGTLYGLLDAVCAAVQGEGPMTVLGVEDTADAERWVAAVCHLMSPGTSRRLYFSTSERAAGLAAARAAGLHLAVVPCADLLEIEPDAGLVLLSDEVGAVEFVEYAESDPSPADHTGAGAEQVHTTPYGARIRVTPWSAIALAVLRDAQIAATLLARQDDIAAQVGDQGLACGWPLAMAVVMSSLTGSRDDDVDEALPAAAVLARAEPPAGVVPGTAVHRTVRQIRARSLGRSTADALAAVRALTVPGSERNFALSVYLERALGDREWLVRPRGVPVPVAPDDRPDVEVPKRAHEALERVCPRTPPHRTPSRRGVDGGGAPELTDAVEALRVLDLVVRARLIPLRPQPDSPVGELVRGVLDRLAGPLLLDAAAGPSLIEWVGPAAEVTQSTVVRPWFDAVLRTTAAPAGCRLSPLLLRWLFPVPPAPPAPHELARPEQVPETLLEAAAQATAVVGDPSAFRAAGVAAGLRTRSADLVRTAAGPPLPIAELEALLRTREPHTLLPLLRPALLAAPTGSELRSVVDAVRTASDVALRTDPEAAPIRDAAELRYLQSRWTRPQEGEDPQHTTSRFVELLVRHLPSSPSGDAPVLAHDLLTYGVAADIVDRILRSSPPPAEPLVHHRPRLSPGEDERTLREVARLVADAARSHVVNDLDVVLAAQLSDPLLADVPFVPSWWAAFAAMGWKAPDGTRRRLLDEVVRQRMWIAKADRRAELVRLARQQVQYQVAHPESGAETHGTMHEYDEFAVRWWPTVGVGDERVLAPVTRRRWPL